jgi:hypothetical protein
MPQSVWARKPSYESSVCYLLIEHSRPLLQPFRIARLRSGGACGASTVCGTLSVLAYFQSSTTPLPPHVVARIWVVSYFGQFRDDLLCIDSTFVEDYWVQERGLSCLRATV